MSKSLKNFISIDQFLTSSSSSFGESHEQSLSTSQITNLKGKIKRGDVFRIFCCLVPFHKNVSFQPSTIHECESILQKFEDFLSKDISHFIIPSSHVIKGKKQQQQDEKLFRRHELTRRVNLLMDETSNEMIQELSKSLNFRKALFLLLNFIKLVENDLKIHQANHTMTKLENDDNFMLESELEMVLNQSQLFVKQLLDRFGFQFFKQQHDHDLNVDLLQSSSIGLDHDNKNKDEIHQRKFDDLLKVALEFRNQIKSILLIKNDHSSSSFSKNEILSQCDQFRNQLTTHPTFNIKSLKDIKKGKKGKEEFITIVEKEK